MITKKYVEKDGKSVCRVTFSLPSNIWAESVYLVGDFNGWNQTSHQFRRASDGSYSVTLDVDCGATYLFRYLEEDGRWLNDNEADGWVPNPFGGFNCELRTDPDGRSGQGATTG